MALLAEAGLWRIRMRIESGSERTKRAVYDRPISNKAIENAASSVPKHAQIVPCYFFIIANPYEASDKLLETFKLMRRLEGPYYAQMFNLVFFPGSELYDRAIQDGIITGFQDSGFDLHFRWGLKYELHRWKKRNLYLNSLLFMAEGKITCFRFGLLLGWIMSFLASPTVIRHCERDQAIARYIVAFKFRALSWRAEAGAVFKTKTGNPSGVYNLNRFVKGKLKEVLLKA